MRTITYGGRAGGAAAITAAALLLGLAGCTQPVVTKADASVLSASFCGVWLPAVAPVIVDFSTQVQADYKTVQNGCAATAGGQAVNMLTVALAAVVLYESITTTYPKLIALSPHDLDTARQVINADRLGAYLGM